jgi:hypothetical protein
LRTNWTPLRTSFRRRLRASLGVGLDELDAAYWADIERFEASYESSVAEAFGNLPSSPAYLSPAFLKAEPSSMNFRC